MRINEKKRTLKVVLHSVFYFLGPFPSRWRVNVVCPQALSLNRPFFDTAHAFLVRKFFKGNNVRRTKDQLIEQWKKAQKTSHLVEVKSPPNHHLHLIQRNIQSEQYFQGLWWQVFIFWSYNMSHSSAYQFNR